MSARTIVVSRFDWHVARLHSLPACLLGEAEAEVARDRECGRITPIEAEYLQAVGDARRRALATAPGPARPAGPFASAFEERVNRARSGPFRDLPALAGCLPDDVADGRLTADEAGYVRTIVSARQRGVCPEARAEPARSGARRSRLADLPGGLARWLARRAADLLAFRGRR